MTVVHISPNSDMPPMGPGSYSHLIYDLATELEHSVVCVDHGHHGETIPVVRVPRPPLTAARKALGRTDWLSGGRTTFSPAAQFAARMADAASSLDPKVVAVWGNPAPLPYLRRACPRAQLVFLQQHYRTPGDVTLLQHADVVGFLTPGGATQALDRLGRFDFTPTITWNPIDLDQFYPADRTEQPFTVLFASKLIGYKGGRMLADWLEKPSQVRWLVANNFHTECDRRLRRRLETLLAEQPHVEWLGGIDRSRMPDVYRSADVTVMPNLGFEGFGLVAGESMASGVPVVATDLPAINEFISHDRTGWLVDPWQAATTVPDLLDDLSDNRERVREIGMAGRELITERFPRSKWIDRMARVLSDVSPT